MKEGGKIEAKGAHGRRICTGIVGIFDATLRCPVVNESENKLVGRFHRKMQFTPFMEPAGSLVCACVCMHVRTYGIRTHVRVRASKREISGPRPRQTPKLCFTADSRFTFFLASLTRVSFLETVRGMRAPPIRHRYHFFFPPPPPS